MIMQIGDNAVVEVVSPQLGETRKYSISALSQGGAPFLRSLDGMAKNPYVVSLGLTALGAEMD